MKQKTAFPIFLLLASLSLAGCSQEPPDDDSENGNWTIEPTPEPTRDYLFQVWALNYTPTRYLEWTELAPENRSDEIEPLFGQADQTRPNPVASTFTNATEWERVRQGFRTEWEARFGDPGNGVQYPARYESRFYNVTFTLRV